MKRFASFLLILVVLLSSVAVSCAPAPVAIQDPIKIDSGQISGTTAGDLHIYKGIPYAAPPVGDLRWKSPQPVAPWQGVKDCTKFGPAPMGYYSTVFPFYSEPSEDCLYLNVWTPAKTTGDKLPVMVWIYGGAFRFGEGSNPLYDGTKLADKGVVVVTFNYRLGPLGFLAHPLLSKEDPHGSSGDYGLLDQIAALQWVHSNIDAFGGDTDRVTIFGQSAGATSVLWLMVSPLSKGLFQRAIAESAYESSTFASLNESKWGNAPKEDMGIQLAKDLGCDTAADPIACMRAKSAKEIMDKGTPPTDVSAPGYRYEPCVDGWVIPDLPLTIFQEGKQHKVPLLIGSNADEWALFQMITKPTLAAYNSYVNSTFGDKAQQVLSRFPASNDDEAKTSGEQLVTLFTFTCPAKAYASSMSKVGSPVYFYQFSRIAPGAKLLGAFHLAEIGYVFGNLTPFMSGQPANVYFNDTDKALSDSMMSYWTSFAANGSPNTVGLTDWPAYDPSGEQYVDLGDSIQVQSGLFDEDCSLLMGALQAKRGH
jgi:para-nitrobenzyl esterase